VASSTAVQPASPSPPGRACSTCVTCGAFSKPCYRDGRTCSSPFLRGDGPSGGYLIVMDFPDGRADSRGKTGEGLNADDLRAALAAAGIPLKECRFTHAVRCRPRDGKLKGMREIKQCRSFLEMEVAMVKPKAILLAGNAALNGLLKRSGILKQRRIRFEYTYRPALCDYDVTVPVCACLSPAYVMRNQDMRKDFAADVAFFAQLSGVTSDALASGKPVKASGIDLLSSVTINKYPKLEEVVNFCQRVRDKKLPLGMDTEADTGKPYVEKDFALLCIGMSTGRDTMVVQIDEPVGNTIDGPTLRPDRGDKHVADAFSKRQMLKAIDEMMHDKNVPIIAHAGKYDSHVLNARFGWNIELAIDTLLLHSFLYPIEGVGHDLDNVISSMLRAWKYKHITDKWVGDGKDAKKFRTIPYDVLATRNGLDCYAVVGVLKPLTKELIAVDKQWRDLAPIKRLAPSEYFKRLVMPSQRMLTRMERRGFPVDRPYMMQLRVQLLKEERAAMAVLKDMDMVREYASRGRRKVMDAANAQKRYPQPAVLKRRIQECAFSPGSAAQVITVLFDICGMAKTEDMLLTDGKQISTTIEALNILANIAKNEGREEIATFVENVLAFKTADKGRSTFIDGVLKYADQNDRVHGSFNQTPRTGRLSSSDPNLQNIPLDPDHGFRFRKMFRAAKGCKLIAADYSQIELRVLAALGKDKAMLEIFKSGRDLHEETARRAYQIPPDEEVPSKKRKAAKAVNFGNVFGQTPKGLAAGLGISEKEAAHLQHLISGEFKGASRWMATVKAFARKHGVVFTWFGRRRQVGNATLIEDCGGLIDGAERIAVNTPVQGTANEICLIAGNALDRHFTEQRQGYYCELVNIVHDELIFECDEDCCEMAMDIIRTMAIEVPTKALGKEFIVPIQISVDCDYTWGDMEE